MGGSVGVGGGSEKKFKGPKAIDPFSSSINHIAKTETKAIKKSTTNISEFR